MKTKPLFLLRRSQCQVECEQFYAIRSELVFKIIIKMKTKPLFLLRRSQCQVECEQFYAIRSELVFSC